MNTLDNITSDKIVAVADEIRQSWELKNMQNLLATKTKQTLHELKQAIMKPLDITGSDYAPIKIAIDTLHALYFIDDDLGETDEINARLKNIWFTKYDLESKLFLINATIDFLTPETKSGNSEKNGKTYKMQDWYSIKNSRGEPLLNKHGIEKRKEFIKELQGLHRFIRQSSEFLTDQNIIIREKYGAYKRAGKDLGLTDDDLPKLIDLNYLPPKRDIIPLVTGEIIPFASNTFADLIDLALTGKCSHTTYRSKKRRLTKDEKEKGVSEWIKIPVEWRIGLDFSLMPFTMTPAVNKLYRGIMQAFSSPKNIGRSDGVLTMSFIEYLSVIRGKRNLTRGNIDFERRQFNKNLDELRKVMFSSVDSETREKRDYTLFSTTKAPVVKADTIYITLNPDIVRSILTKFRLDFIIPELYCIDDRAIVAYAFACRLLDYANINSRQRVAKDEPQDFTISIGSLLPFSTLPYTTAGNRYNQIVKAPLLDNFKRLKEKYHFLKSYKFRYEGKFYTHEKILPLIKKLKPEEFEKVYLVYTLPHQKAIYIAKKGEKAIEKETGIVNLEGDAG